jgi:hypothetical protein
MPSMDLRQAWRLRLERRRLSREQKAGVRDLGGLVLEMVRRDRFRSDLLRRKAEALLELEWRLDAIDWERARAFEHKSPPSESSGT